MLVARRRPLLLGLLALAPLACGGGEEKKGPDKSPTIEVKGEAKPPPVPELAGSTSAGTGTGGSTSADPFDTEGWGDEDTEAAATMGDEGGSGESGEAAAEPTLFDGPCFVRWSKGPILRFDYAADGTGGRLRIDAENDGKSDVCARFWTKDDRTHKVTVDEGCDSSTEAIITPTYDDALNLATATYTDKRDGAEAKHDITLVTLPAFTGIAPGYPLYAERDGIDLKSSDGRVTQAVVRKPLEGPPVKLVLKYDGEGRVTRIDEDHEADGKVDRRFDYRYDEVGNVTGMTLSETTVVDGKRSTSKKTAKLGYGCWATTP